MAKNRIITVQDIPITISEAEIDDYISITDMAAAKSDSSRAADVVRNWLRNRTTLEFLSTWEEIYNPDFKLYLIKEFQRLKEQENDVKKVEWNAKRFLSKNNYLIQTDAVKNYLVPNCDYRENLQWLPYAEEADLSNEAQNITHRIENADSDIRQGGMKK